VGLHLAAALYVGGGSVKDLLALAAAPFYVAWKLTMVPVILRGAKKDVAWVRTARGHSTGERQ
jgi:hypothetical protein